MQSIEVITKLAEASSRVRKERIIMEAYATNCTEFFEAVQLACDPFINFGIKKVSEIIEDDGAPGTLTFAAFRHLCEQLRTQTLSGTAAQFAIYQAADCCDTTTWNNLYRRILLKDLRVVDSSEVNRVLKRLGPLAEKDLGIPTFRCQVATDSVIIPKTGQYLVDVKLPGDRLLAVLDKNPVGYNAKGKRSAICVQTEQALRSLAAHLPSPIVMDGVLIATGEYIVFDMIPLVDFRSGLSAKTQRQRRSMLELLQTAGAFSGAPIHVLPQIEINFGSADGRRAFDEFGRQANDQGYHTLVVKKPEAPYIGKPNRAWTLNPIITNT